MQRSGYQLFYNLKKGGVLIMDANKSLDGKNETTLTEEWEKPVVKELDIITITKGSNWVLSANDGWADYS